MGLAPLRDPGLLPLAGTGAIERSDEGLLVYHASLSVSLF